MALLVQKGFKKLELGKPVHITGLLSGELALTCEGPDLF